MFAYGIIRRILAEIGKVDRPVVVLNVKDRTCPFQAIGWDQLATLQSTAILVEDIVSCSNKQFEQLAFSLAVKCHHFSTNPQVLITHQVTRTSICLHIKTFCNPIHLELYIYRYIRLVGSSAIDLLRCGVGVDSFL